MKVFEGFDKVINNLFESVGSICFSINMLFLGECVLKVMDVVCYVEYYVMIENMVKI